MITFNVLSQVDLQTFFEMFDMPDTYYSWWLVTELHAWMLSVRLSVGNSRGKKIVNYSDGVKKSYYFIQ